MKQKKIAIRIGTQHLGSFVALGNLLAVEGYKVEIWAIKKEVGDIIDGLVTHENVNIVDLEDRSQIVSQPSVSEISRIEIKYGVTLGFLCSLDRGFGYGFLNSIGNYPRADKATWSKEIKYGQICNEILLYECLIESGGVDIVLGLQHSFPLWLVTRDLGLTYLGVGYVKLGRRLFWVDNPGYTSSLIKDELSAALASGETILNRSREPDRLFGIGAEFNHRKAPLTYRAAFKKAIKMFLMEAFRIIRLRGRPVGSYRHFSWLFTPFVAVFNRNLVKGFGAKLTELGNTPLIYVPLHLEPEIALLNVSPEFNNVIEMIFLLAKVAPANYTIIIREHPLAFAVRDQRFYEKLRCLPNVKFAHPDEPSIEWVKRAKISATISGTVGVEAVLCRRPVLSFGQHQLINDLPTVRFCSDYLSVKTSLAELLSIPEDSSSFDIARAALIQAQTNVSFDVPDFEENYKSVDLQEPIGMALLAGLKEKAYLD